MWLKGDLHDAFWQLYFVLKGFDNFILYYKFLNKFIKVKSIHYQIGKFTRKTVVTLFFYQKSQFFKKIIKNMFFAIFFFWNRLQISKFWKLHPNRFIDLKHPPGCCLFSFFLSSMCWMNEIFRYKTSVLFEYLLLWIW